MKRFLIEMSKKKIEKQKLQYKQKKKEINQSSFQR
jgi:hypothetical protein